MSPNGELHNDHTKNQDESKILIGALSFMGQEILFLDMTAAYSAPEFNFATSIYIDCCDETEFDCIFAVLSHGGMVMMGPEAVEGFRKCAWVTDKFGVTWQPVWE